MFDSFNYRYIIIKLNNENELNKLKDLFLDIFNSISGFNAARIYPNYLFINIDSIRKHKSRLELSFLSYNVTQSDIDTYIINNPSAYKPIFDMSNIDDVLYFLRNEKFKSEYPTYKPKKIERTLENVQDIHDYDYFIIKVDSKNEIDKLKYELKNTLKFDEVNGISDNILNDFTYPNYLLLERKYNNIDGDDIDRIDMYWYDSYVSEETINELLRRNEYWYPDIFSLETIDKLGVLFNKIYPNYKPKKIVRTLENRIIKYSDFDIDNLEFRKGSLEYGDLVSRIIEFLRIYKNENDDKLAFNIKDFEDKSNISIDEINKLNSLPNKKSLFDFDIEIKDDKIIFNNLQNKKSVHHLESITNFDNAIRNNYSILGVKDFYEKIGDKYENPHLNDIKLCMDKILEQNIIKGKVLDLGAGNGEITTILKENGYNDIIGCDPFLYKQYEKNTNNKCLDFSFEDIQKGAIDNMKFDTIICSYSMHLANESIIPDLLWKLSLISNALIILSPNKKPIIKEENGWNLVNESKINKCRYRIFESNNINI